MAEMIKDVEACDDAGTIEAFARTWCGRVYDHIYPSDSEPLSPQDEGAMRNALPPKCHKLLSPDITAFVNEERMAQDWGEVSVRLIAASLKDVNVLATALAEDADRRTAGQEVLQPKLLDLLLPKFELWGLLLAKGIDPTRRQWARDVALEYMTLAGLANTPWPTIAGLIKVDELDEEEQQEEKEPPSDEPAEGPSEASAEKEQEVPITSTELHTLQSLFANAPNAPPIRKEVTATNQSMTSTAAIVEYILCPMKSFRIDPNEMGLSDDATESASSVGSLREAGSFLDTFGSHMSSGTHLMEGSSFIPSPRRCRGGQYVDAHEAYW